MGIKQISITDLVLNLRDAEALSTKWVVFVELHNLKNQRSMWKGKKKDCQSQRQEITPVNSVFHKTEAYRIGSSPTPHWTQG